MSRCEDTLGGQHGAADVHGKCVYCRKKIESKVSMPTIKGVSDLTYYYGMTYDPDFPYEFDGFGGITLNV